MPKTIVTIKNNRLINALEFLKNTKNPRPKIKAMLNKGYIWDSDKLKNVIFYKYRLSYILPHFLLVKKKKAASFIL